MRRFRLELTSEFDYDHPNWVSQDWIHSPMGKLCHELMYKQWLEADEGSLGHRIIADLAPQIPNAKTSWVEVDLDSEWQEEQEIRTTIEDSRINRSLRDHAPMIRLPRKPWGFNNV